MLNYKLDLGTVFYLGPTVEGRIRISPIPPTATPQQQQQQQRRRHHGGFKVTHGGHSSPPFSFLPPSLPLASRARLFLFSGTQLHMRAHMQRVQQMGGAVLIVGKHFYVVVGYKY